MIKFNAEPFLGHEIVICVTNIKSADFLYTLINYKCITRRYFYNYPSYKLLLHSLTTSFETHRVTIHKNQIASQCTAVTHSGGQDVLLVEALFLLKA